MNRIPFVLFGCALFASPLVQAQSWCSNQSITLSGGAAAVGSPYPSTIAISGAATSITTFSVSIEGLTHSFPDDVDLLLVGPAGQKMIIQSDAGGGNDTFHLRYVLTDSGAATLPDSSALTISSFKPTNYTASDAFAAPAPAGPYSEPAPAGAATFASVFGGTNPNGTWSLYAVDDANVDGGQLANWCLHLGAPLKISELRVRGPSGANDEYIEILNDSPVATTVSTTDGSSGFAIAASNGIARCVIPNGTVLGPYGHFLCANSAAYSLSGHPGGTANATYTADIPDNAGVALFRTALSASFVLANRLDAVGSTSEANTLYKEGTGYPALTPFSIDYAFQRDACGKQGLVSGLTRCPNAGYFRDTNNNAADFVFVDTNGTSAGAGQRLGVPGPESLASPQFGNGSISHTRLDSCSQQLAAPNFLRDFVSVPAQNSTFGTIDLRRTITNNTGALLTRLRYRIVDQSTFPVSSAFADLRPLTTTTTTASVDRPPCDGSATNVNVSGTSLETPPSQPNGGGFNSTLSVSLGGGLAAGSSIDVHFRFGIQQVGIFRFALVPEGLPVGGGPFDTIQVVGCTNTCTDLIFIDGVED